MKRIAIVLSAVILISCCGYPVVVNGGSSSEPALSVQKPKPPPKPPKPPKKKTPPKPPKPKGPKAPPKPPHP